MITTNTKKFSEALSIATRCCANNIMPILSCVLIDARDGRLHLTSTNLDLMISTSVEAEVKKPGKLCIYGKRLATIVGSMAGTDLTMEFLKNYRLSLAGGPSHFKIMGLQAEDFPKIEDPKDSISFSVSQVTLREYLLATEDAQSADSARYALMGINVSFDHGKVYMVATDGRRMHCVSGPSAESGWPSVIIPKPAITLLSGLLGEGNVRFDLVKGANSSTIWFTIDRPEGDIVIRSKLVAANYPQWRQVMPKENNLRYSVKRDDFVASLRRVSLALDDKSTAVRLAFGGLGVNLSASSSENGESNELVACTGPAGEYEIHVSARFLMDAMEATKADEVSIGLNGKQPGVSPLVVSAGTMEAVVLPVRLS
jgi:DNA polymerase-3 subunit beta